MRVVIPAAGLGRRFADQKLEVPKELLPLGGKPVLGHALAEAARAGFEQAIVVISPPKRQIQTYLETAELPIRVSTVVQPEPRGIGDAVLRAWTGEPVAVLLPDDVVTETSHWTALLSTHKRHLCAALCVRTVPPETRERFGIAECAGTRVTALFEKPRPGITRSNLAVFGRYVVTEPVIRSLRSVNQDGELELTQGFAGAIAQPPGVLAVHFGGRIYDCGTPSEYRRAQEAFRPN